MKIRQFIRKLQAAGVEIIPNRGKGGHYLAKYKGANVAISFHSNKDMPPYYLKKICKQLGIDPDEVL